MTVTSTDDQGIRPGLTQVLDQPFQHRVQLYRAEVSQIMRISEHRGQITREADLVIGVVE